MHTSSLAIMLVVFSVLTAGCSPRITSDEAKVLVALDEIQRGTESNIDYSGFVQLLNSAQAEIGSLKQNNDQNPCFLGAVDKCFAAYEIAGKAWKNKLSEKDASRKEDMDMTLSFSLSFAALNIEKANKCYK